MEDDMPVALYFIDVSCHAKACPSSYPYGVRKRRSTLYVGTSWAECYANARAAGWILCELNDDRVACLCPACVTHLESMDQARTLH
jgi:hypothetical protein